MKTTLLLAFTLVFGGSVLAQLSGTYTVYGSSPDYATIQDACDDLMASGQSGPVVFNIRDGIYTEEVTLNTVSGNSSTNTITFQSESMDSSLVKVLGTTAPTFSFNNVGYVNFNQMVLAYVGSPTWTVNGFGCTDFSFDHVEIINTGIGGGDYAVYFSGTTDFNNLKFMDCDIIGNGSGVYVYSSSTNLNNIRLENSGITVQGGYGVHAQADVNITGFDVISSTINSPNDYGFYIYTSNGDISDLNFSMSKIDSYREPVYIYADKNISNVLFDNDSLLANVAEVCCFDPNAAYLYASNGTIDGVSVTNCYLGTTTNNGYGLELYSSDAKISNVDVLNNEIEAYSGMYFYGYAGGSNWNINDNTITAYFGYGMDLEPYYGIGSNINIINNNVNASDDYGIYLYTYANLDQIIIDTNYVNSSYESIYLYDDEYGAVTNVWIRENTVVSSGEAGIYAYTYGLVENFVITGNDIDAYSEGILLEGYYGGVRNAKINDNIVYSDDDDAIYIYSEGIVNDIEIKNNNDLESYYETIYIEAYSGINNLDIMDNNILSDGDDGIYLYSDYSDIKNVNIINNNIVTDTTDYYDAIYLYSSSSGMDSITISDNELYAYEYGVYLYGEYGNAQNLQIKHNDVWGGEYGFYLDGVGSNSSISWNNIYPLDYYGSQTDYGIYLYGYYGANDNVTVSDNYIKDAYEYGIEAEYFTSLAVERNWIGGTAADDNLTGIYLYDVYGNNTIVNANKILTTEAYDGIYFSGCNFPDTDPAIISNNFITNVRYSIDLEGCSNVRAVNNSIASTNTNQMVYLSGVNNVGLYNNLLKDNTGSGTINYAIGINSGITINNNVYDFDTTVTNMSGGSEFGTNASLHDFQVATSQDLTSLYADPMYVNDTTDLHIDCANTALSVGMSLPYVMSDIDGTMRPATNPTIGAHEINGTFPNLLADSLELCIEADIMMLTPVSGTYLWSTGETTPSITVTATGMYWLKVTDVCGSNSTDTIVVYSNGPTASFIAGTGILTGFFSNTSTGAVSYEWNFGDGGTSAEVNPTHDYAGDGTYTVTLVATDDCGNTDTTTKDIKFNTAGTDNGLVEENISVYPNPTNGNVTVDFNQLTGQTISIVLMDLNGRTLLNDQLINVSGEHKMNLDLSDFEDGMYILVLQSDTDRITKRLIKE